MWSLCRSFVIATSKFATATHGKKKGVSLLAHHAFLNTSAQEFALVLDDEAQRS